MAPLFDNNGSHYTIIWSDDAITFGGEIMKNESHSLSTTMDHSIVYTKVKNKNHEQQLQKSERNYKYN